MLRKQIKNYCVIKKLKVISKAFEEVPRKEMLDSSEKVIEPKSHWNLPKDDQLLVNHPVELNLIELF